MSPDIPFGFERGLRLYPAVPWSSFYALRIAAMQRIAPVTRSETPQPPTWGTLADACGADAADALDVLRDARRGTVWYLDGIAEDEMRRHLFARWLVRQGILKP